MAHPGKVGSIIIMGRTLNYDVFMIQVADMTCSFDGKYLFTAGGEDYTVNMWTINTEYNSIYFIIS